MYITLHEVSGIFDDINYSSLIEFCTIHLLIIYSIKILPVLPCKLHHFSASSSTKLCSWQFVKGIFPYSDFAKINRHKYRLIATSLQLTNTQLIKIVIRINQLCINTRKREKASFTTYNFYFIHIPNTLYISTS